MRHIDRRRFIRRATAFLGSLGLAGCGGGASGGEESEAGPQLSSGSAAGPSAPVEPSLPSTLVPRATDGSTARFTLTSAVDADLAPFCLGFAFRPGEVASGKGVTCDVQHFQASVLNRWPDDSVKFAILAGRVSLTGGETKEVVLRASSPGVTGAALTEADLEAANVSAELSFAPHGAAELSPLIGVLSTYDSASGRWTAGRVHEIVAGPEMSSWLYQAPLGTGRHLSAWFEVRYWATGHVEILPWLENGKLRVAGPTSYDGTLSLTMNGSVRMSQALTIAHHCRVVAVKGRPAGHWAPNASQVRYAHDTAYLQSTRLVPAYMAEASNALIDRQPATYEPLTQARFPTAMGSGGYDPSIGLLPEWDVSYLVGNGVERALNTVLVHGFAAGRYGIHYRDETTNRPLRFSSYPNLCLADSASLGVSDNGTSSKSAYTPAASGAKPPTWANSHHPSVGYLAYLVSGWFYFVEEVQFAATLGYLKQQDVAREGARGLLLTNVGANTTRGAAWALRTLCQAATVTPDKDVALRQELLGSIASNIDYYHHKYVVQLNNPFGVCAPYSDYSSGDGKHTHAMWMEDFFTAAWGYAISLKLALTNTSTSRLSTFFQWKARSIVGRLSDAGAPTQYSYLDAAQYTVAVAPIDNADFNNGTGPWYGDWGAIYTATTGAVNTDASITALRGAYFPEPTSYWGNLQPAISYAVEHGVANASAAYARMTSASNWSQIVERFDDNPVWAVVPKI